MLGCSTKSRYIGFVTTPERISRNELLDQVMATIRAKLPPSWQLSATREASRRDHGRDAVIEIRSPNGARATLAVEVRRRLDHAGLPVVLAQLESTDDIPFIVAPFLSPRTRELLAQAGVNYCDASDNLRLAVDNPAIFVETTGKTVNLWRGNRAIRSLRGPISGRVVRALCDFRPPFGVLELAATAKIPPASVSRVIVLVEQEGLLTRTAGGSVLTVEWEGLIRRWTVDYAFWGSNHVRRFIARRGLSELTKMLPACALRYAITGPMAAEHLVRGGVGEQAALYVDYPADAAKQLDLDPVASLGDVLLVEPFNTTVFERTWARRGLVYAAPSQIAADVLTTPGYDHANAEAFLAWMRGHEWQGSVGKPSPFNLGVPLR